MVDIKNKLKEEYERSFLILQNYQLPIIIREDFQYLPTLKALLGQYLKQIKNSFLIDQETKMKTEDNIEDILKAIEVYYDANIYEARKIIYNMLSRYKDDDYIISNLDDSPALRGVTRFSTNSYFDQIAAAPLSFFRARVSKKEFSRKDFLHIPFNKRGLVSTQRFSIAGVPCMYFGATSYVCWLELNKPRYDELHISSYTLPKELRVLNLAITQGIVSGFTMGNEHKEYAMSMIELFPLVMATSFKVIEGDRVFKSEYIVSQLIMQCLTELGVEGVAYISKQIEHNDLSIQLGNENFPTCVNLAIPMKNNKNDQYSELAKKIPLTEPIKIDKCISLIQNTSFNKQVVAYPNLFDSQLTQSGVRRDYKTLEFSEIDDFLVNQKHVSYNNL
ncbi:RES domain-containing protein [Bacillus cereus]|uniref:RES domain-containing protein n=1 Tax=Bacillus cereus group TaxID=86661 RepID=UPI001FAF1D4E|nr:RES domain-containing protein [Bacillus cereus]MCJ0850267.1 RES domain-containing protein [Bacillus cereus]MDA2051317.1 RES domain-containing protein [Bacillus cereus]